MRQGRGGPEAERGAGLVEPVVRGTTAAQHVAVGESGDRVPDRGRGAEPAECRVGRGEAFPAGRGQCRVVLAVAGRAQQQLAGAAFLLQRLHRGHRGLRRDRIVEQGGHHGGRHDPAVARLGVDHPQFQVPARPDRREQGGHVIREVVGGGRGPDRAAHPVAEREPGRRGPPAGAGITEQHDLGVEHVAHPGVPGIGIFRPGCAAVRRAWFHLLRGPGAAGIEPGPHGLAGQLPAGQPAVLERGVGERCHQHRAQPVQQVPAPPESGGAALLLARVHAHLNGGGTAHHDPAPGAAAVEELFHGRVARQVQHAAWGSEGIEAMPREAEPGRGDGLAEGREVAVSRRHAAAQAGRGRGTQLDLAAGFGRQPTPARERPGLVQAGEGCGHSPLVNGESRVPAVTHQPFQLDPDLPGWAGLESDPVRLLLRRPFGQRWARRAGIIAALRGHRLPRPCR